MELISVIVPVYKTEAYLDRCVQSIVDQTYTNLEIILVDDGSPDNCPQICDEWAKKDSRILVIHKANGGLSDARNVGMRVMRGEYVAFVDSDDWLAKAFIENLYTVASENHCEAAGCVFCMTSELCAESGNMQANLLRIVDRYTAVSELIDDKIRQVVWNKLYRRDLIQDISFAKEKYHEDEFWSYQVLGRITRYAEVDYKGYFYFQRQESIMGAPYSIKRLDALEARIERLAFLAEHLPQLTDKGQINLFFTCVYHGQMALKYLNQEEKKVAFMRLKEVSQQWKLTSAQKSSLKLTHKIWAQIAERSLWFACWIRNALSVGL